MGHTHLQAGLTILAAAGLLSFAPAGSAQRDRAPDASGGLAGTSMELRLAQDLSPPARRSPRPSQRRREMTVLLCPADTPPPSQACVPSRTNNPRLPLQYTCRLQTRAPDQCERTEFDWRPNALDGLPGDTLPICPGDPACDE